MSYCWVCLTDILIFEYDWFWDICEKFGFLFCFCFLSKLSDAECLQESMDLDSDKIESLSSEVLERKVKSLEKENKDLSKRFQGMYNLDVFFSLLFLFLLFTLDSSLFVSILENCFLPFGFSGVDLLVQ